jgi:hypothetical protein
MKFRLTIAFGLFLITHMAFGQFVTGVVTDIMGKPLVGANITWEGTEKGTVTDANGTFTRKT